MIPDDLENYGQSLFATALSANNILLTITSGYFTLEAQFKPLSHTWSLGVEEQYYALVPVMLLLAMRWRGRRGALLVLLGSSAVALGICEYMRNYHVEANFYLLHSRFWQLGLGGLASLAQRPLLAWAGPSLRQLLAALGLAMILASLFWLSSDLGLPGWPSLLPILGTCLILVFANQRGAGRLLSSGPLVAVGLISYSAYLYHMPVLAFVRIASLEPPSPAALASTLPLILLLAWLSWRYIEQPFRDRERTSNSFVLWFCGATLTAAVACGLALHLTSGMRAFTPYVDREELFNLKLTEDFNKIPFRFEGREFPTAERSRNVLVLGNSFARDFINMGPESGAFAHVDVSYTAVETCQPLPPGLTDRMRRSGAVVLGSGVLEGNTHCALDRIKLLESLHVAHIIVLGTKQFGYNNNAVLLLPEAERYKFRARPLDYAIRDNTAGRAEIPARYYIDLLAMLDNGSRTVPVFTPERKLISQDRRHMTRAGARFMGEKVFALPQFAWLRAKP
jgi:peptidoglycan/LPS O-acetylase OafA/YrhL